MSKQVLLRVELEFADGIYQDEDVMEIAQNVARAIVAETNGQGIAPQEGDTYLEVVRVTPHWLNKTIIEHVYENTNQEI
jgi:hypothetical protein